MKRYLLIIPAFLVLGVSVAWACIQVPSCDGDCVVASPTPSASPEASQVPETTPQPYHEPDAAGAPPLAVCKETTHTPQIAWYMDKENGAEFIWSAVEEPYVHTYKIEYKVNGVTYNVLVDDTRYDIHADGHVTDVRVAATHESCVGLFSAWRHTNVETGSK